MNQQNPPFEKQQVRAVIGLGNPGPSFTHTRHNIGFRVVEALAAEHQARWTTTGEMMHAEITVTHDGSPQKLILIKPLTFMNSSGRVIPWLTKKGIKGNELVVIHDELEKPFGYVGLRFAGSAKGHNGLRSIIATLGADFWRLRCGIGRPEVKEEVGNYVLARYTAQEESQLGMQIAEALDLIR